MYAKEQYVYIFHHISNVMSCHWHSCLLGKQLLKKKGRKINKYFFYIKNKRQYTKGICKVYKSKIINILETELATVEETFFSIGLNYETHFCYFFTDSKYCLKCLPAQSSLFLFSWFYHIKQIPINLLYGYWVKTFIFVLLKQGFSQLGDLSTLSRGCMT